MNRLSAKLGTRLYTVSKTSPRILAIGMLLVLAQSFILLTPALVNGFPFVFSDTGAYLESALTQHVPYDRPVYYGIFAAMLHWRISLWPVVIAQSLIVVRLVNLILSAIFGLDSWIWRFCLTALLATASGLPSFVGQITPDVFTSAMILAIALCTMSWANLTLADRIFVLGVIIASVTFHNGNVLIAFAIVPSVIFVAMFGWRSPSWRGLVRMSCAVAIGVAALLASNIIAGRGITLSSGSSVILFAKLLEYGPALETLHDVCTRRPADFAVCRQRQALDEYANAPFDPTRPIVMDDFLWSGPLASLGGFEEFHAEAAILVRDALHRLRWKHAALAARQTLEQMRWFRAGDGLRHYRETVQPSMAIRWIFGESVFNQYNQSLQQTSALSFSGLNLLQYVSVSIAALVITIAFVFQSTATQNTKSLAVLVLTFLVMNAAVTGTLAGVSDRYQSRVIWLLPFVAAALVLSTAKKRVNALS